MATVVERKDVVGAADNTGDVLQPVNFGQGLLYEDIFGETENTFIGL